MYLIELFIVIIVLLSLAATVYGLKLTVCKIKLFGRHSTIDKVLGVLTTVLWSVLLLSYLTKMPELRLHINGWYAIMLIYTFMLFKFTHTHYGHYLYAKTTNLENRFTASSPWIRVGNIECGLDCTNVGQYFGIPDCKGKIEIYRHLANTQVVYVTTVKDVMYEEI